MKYMQKSVVRISRCRSLVFLFTFFIVLSSILPACTGTSADLFFFLLIAPTLDWSSDDDTDDWVYCLNQILRVNIYIYSNADGLLIPDSYVRIFNQDAERICYDYTGYSGDISVRFRSYSTPEALLPCWDLCEDSDVETYGHTQCLEPGQTWELGVEAYADGYASQADTLTLDNQSITMNMTFFLDPI